MKTIKILTLVLLIAAIGSSCKNDKQLPEVLPAGTTPVKVKLTDTQGNFQQVNVDITGVEFKQNNGTTMNLNVNAGIYNLLDYSNGNDTLIASADFPSGTLSQIRLILGSNNSVMVDSVVYPLSTPSADQSGLKLNVHSVLTAGVTYNLLLDFDANQSVVLTGNGVYKLKPVIKVIDTATSGSIHGVVVTQPALPATVSASDSTNTYFTSTDLSGNFLIQGVVPGTYSVTITPMPPYVAITLSNIIVTLGNLSDLGNISF